MTDWVDVAAEGGLSDGDHIVVDVDDAMIVEVGSRQDYRDGRRQWRTTSQGKAHKKGTMRLMQLQLR